MENPFKKIFGGGDPSPEEKAKKNLEALPPLSREVYDALRRALESPRALELQQHMVRFDTVDRRREFVVYAVPAQYLSEWREHMEQNDPARRVAVGSRQHWSLKYPAFIELFERNEPSKTKVTSLALRGDDFGLARRVHEISGEEKPQRATADSLIGELGAEFGSASNSSLVAGRERDNEEEMEYRSGRSKPDEAKVREVLDRLREML